MAYNLKTRNGYNMYEMSSMVQKAIRRADIPHACYAVNELSENFREYLWRRLLTVSAEDCFGIMTKEIVALKKADEITNTGRKKGEWTDIFLAKAVVLLCMARKNRDADYVALNFMWGDRLLTDEEFDEFVDYGIVEKLKTTTSFDIPEYVFDKHTRRGKAMGKNTLDFFREENEGLEPHQMSLFDYGSFGGWYDYCDRTDDLAPRTRREYPAFADGKETDPTHGGKDLVVKEPNWGKFGKRHV